MNWSRKHTLMTGLALIVAANAVVLAGAAYNRSGEAESALQLTERELKMPYRWRGNKEDSGLYLEMKWRILPAASKNKEQLLWHGEEYGSSPRWLNETKMTELGFTPRSARSNKSELGEFAHELPRSVLLVLEFNGDAYTEALLRAQKRSEHGKDLKDAREELEKEKTMKTRLFVVDAGLDHSKLRAKYPDRTRFAIVHGEVRPALEAHSGVSAPPRSGFVSDVSAKNINVPLDKRSVFDAFRNLPDSTDQAKARYEIAVAFGQRLEPWIMQVVAR